MVIDNIVSERGTIVPPDVKAKQLFSECLKSITGDDNKTSVKFVKILIKEMMNTFVSIDNVLLHDSYTDELFTPNDMYHYWRQVKIELNKL